MILIGLSSYFWSSARESKQEMKQELYRNILQQGIIERDDLFNPLKAKLLFAKSISLNSNITEEKNSKILYNSMNKVELKNIYEHNKSKYGCWGADFSKNEQEILSWSGNLIKLWNKNNNKTIHEFKHNKIVQGAIFNKSNSKILSWSDDKTVRLWNVDNKKFIVFHAPFVVYMYLLHSG